MNINIINKIIDLETDNISSDMVDKILVMIADGQFKLGHCFFSKYIVRIRGETIPGKSTFYEIMKNENRLDYFMDLEASVYTRYIKSGIITIEDIILVGEVNENVLNKIKAKC